MFALDRKTVARLEPTTRRILIVEPNPHAYRLLADMMKGLGAQSIARATDETRALKLAENADPGIIFMEYAGANLNGERLARKIRRSNLRCRRAPIIVVTAEATAQTILGARDAGVHEFLRRPFTATDLFRRVENVATRPRDWIEAVGYVGPDRRRFNSGEYTGLAKRASDQVEDEDPIAAAKDRAMRILASSLNQFHIDPAQAVRSIQEQANVLRECALKTADIRLTVCSSHLSAAIMDGGGTRASLIGPIEALLALHPIDDKKKAG